MKKKKILAILLSVAPQIALDIEILKKIKKMSAKQDRFDADLQQLNQVSNNIAAELKDLKAQIEAGNVSDASLDTLEQNIKKLQAMGTDPNNPAGTESTGTAGGTGTEQPQQPGTIDTGNVVNAPTEGGGINVDANGNVEGSNI